MQKWIIVFFSLLLLSSLSAAAVVMKDGTVYEHVIVSESGEQVVIRKLNGETLAFPREAIESIAYEGGAVKKNTVEKNTEVAQPTQETQKSESPAPTPPQQASPTPSGFHTHDGFYLNMMWGLGSLNFSETRGGDSLSMGGLSGQFSLKLDGAVTRSVVLFGAIDSFSAPSPDAKMVIDGVTYSGSLQNTTYSSLMIGVGAGIYFGDNFLAKLTLGQASAILEYKSGGISYKSETDKGFGVNVSIGKEWWISADWGIGVAFFGHMSSIKDEGVPATQTYLGVAFTATYN